MGPHPFDDRVEIEAPEIGGLFVVERVRQCLVASGAEQPRQAARDVLPRTLQLDGVRRDHVPIGRFREMELGAGEAGYPSSAADQGSLKSHRIANRRPTRYRRLRNGSLWAPQGNLVNE